MVQWLETLNVSGWEQSISRKCKEVLFYKLGMKFSHGKPKLLIIADDFYDFRIAGVVSFFMWTMNRIPAE